MLGVDVALERWMMDGPYRTYSTFVVLCTGKIHRDLTVLESHFILDPRDRGVDVVLSKISFDSQSNRTLYDF
jgi:hypothetical protein